MAIKPAGVAASLEWPAKANAVPRRVYTDPELFALETERIFKGPTWHCVGHEAEVRNPGDFKTTRLAGIPLLVDRDEHGQVHVLVNACAHRGAKVVRAACGNAARSLFQCGYHLWTYELDGVLTGVPLPQLMPQDFDKSDYHLPELRTETAVGLIFCTLSEEAPPLTHYLGDTDFVEALHTMLWGGDLEYLGSQKLVFQCNWKIYAENMSDGYHSRVLHAGARYINGPPRNQSMWETKDPSHGKYGHNWTRGHNTPPDSRGELRDASIVDIVAKPCDETGLTPANLGLIFPSLAFSDNNDGLHLRYIKPIDVGSTEIEFAYFGRAGESEELKIHRARTGSNCYGPVGLITLEDGQAFGMVQRGAQADDYGVNNILAGLESRRPPAEFGSGGGEANALNFYAVYRRLMGL